MRWQMGRRSDNIVDRRGSRGGMVKGGGGLFVLALAVYLLGRDPTELLMQGISQNMQSTRLSPQEAAEQKDFVAAVLGNTEDVWEGIYRTKNSSYRKSKLVIFTGAVDSACGYAGSSVGPFYCPLDQQIYLDLNFFHDLQHQLNAPGDFARAYVIAHEIGHHVQRLNGIEARVRAQQQRVSDSEGRARCPCA
jgi:predicted metalloprotease